MTDFPADTTVAVLGGTGPQGRGLARRFAAAGLDVVLGSRSAERAAEAAAALTEAVGRDVRGLDNAPAPRRQATWCSWSSLGRPPELLESLRAELAGKVVVDCVNPLGFDKQGPFALAVTEGSATEQAQAVLPDSTVVGAFHHLSAVLLEDPEVPAIDSDVLVLGDEREATDLVQALAATIPGCRGMYAGRRRNAHQVEALTANLIAANRRYQAHAGLRVTDV